VVLPVATSQVARITGMSYQCLAFMWTSDHVVYSLKTTNYEVFGMKILWVLSLFENK
jgi:hypothetical protein